MTRVVSPGLHVSPKTKASRRRMLPVPGEILVKKGQQVKMGDPVARTDLPATPIPVRAASILGLPPVELKAVVTVTEGDRVSKGQILAEESSFFGLFRNAVTSPFAGTVETISKVTGQIMLRPKPTSLEVNAYLPGMVTDIVGDIGVVIEAEVCQVQGIFGLGGERTGVLKKAVDGPDALLDETRILESHSGAVILGGARVTPGGLARARQVGASALITGSAQGQDLMELLGGELNPSATGNENIGFTLVLTEGFGELEMGQRSFHLLSKLDGAEVAVNGTTQIRAGVLRPEVIGPAIDEDVPVRSQTGTIEIGDKIRIVRGKAFGKTAIITGMPSKPQPIGSGGVALVVEVELNDKNRLTVPKPNIERI
ncbi:MAG: hypothetical protein GY762_04635 [Proteobacteria bacterium]|nr:hypothetical protein [Pseudomonadota bacterium]